MVCVFIYQSIYIGILVSSDIEPQLGGSVVGAPGTGFEEGEGMK
jgi:hypothetical protein